MDTFEGEEDQMLFSQEVAEGNTVAQDVNLEIENQANNQLVDTQDGDTQPIDEHIVDELLEELMNNEGFVVIYEDNVVRKEEVFVEEEDEDDKDRLTSKDSNVPAMVEELDDQREGEVASRPRRTNAEAGVERIQMEFGRKGYGAKRGFILVNNGEVGKKLEHVDKTRTYMDVACNVVFVQVDNTIDPQRHNKMSDKASFKKYGQEAVASMIKEYTQLNERAVPGKPVVIPTDPRSLTPLERNRAMRAVNLIKEKRGGDLIGRTCVNGSGQRKYFKQYESVASPTAALESLIVTLLIDAYKGRDVAIYDVSDAYLQASLSSKGSNERVLMKLEGDLIDIMAKVNPEYAKNVIHEHSKEVLYMEILQVIYGCIESALRWYELYFETLMNEGFKINPCDKCVANKIINGKQCTLVWYVDDDKVSHVDDKEVTEVIDLMKGHFGDLTVTRGKTHHFLGINIHMHDKKTQK